MIFQMFKTTWVLSWILLLITTTKLESLILSWFQSSKNKIKPNIVQTKKWITTNQMSSQNML
jgi:hypothetical protein